MRYIVEIPPNIARKINTLIEKGNYGSFHDFLLVAIENQLFIESHELGVEEEPKLVKARAIRKVSPPQVKRTRTTPISELHELRTDWEHPLKPVEPPKLENLWSKFLWGHYNRLFPTKITLRVLANLLKDQEKVDLTSLQEKAAYVATEVGIYLKRIDRKTRRKRWEALSVALPNNHRNVGAVSRFKLQFVGYVTKQSVLHGMPVALRFMNIIRRGYDQEAVVGITEAGIEFAKLVNPVIDSNSIEGTLSDEEVAFYISHIRSNQPYEMNMIKAVIEAIENGQRTYDEVKNQVSKLDRNWSTTVLSTMCTGILSRMRELRILEMQREGLRSHYKLGPNARMVKV